VIVAPLGATDHQRTWVKICGLTRPEDAEHAARSGADALGIVFAASPRQLDIERASEILGAVPARIARVGVFADQPPEFVQEAARVCRLDWVQLSGHEPAELAAVLSTNVIKAVHVRDVYDLEAARSYPAQAFLLDAPVMGGRMGGTGSSFDWSQAERLPWPRYKVIVAGGLNPGNVSAAIERLRPGGVDVSSGVESSPGIKDRSKIDAFMSAVREVDARLRAASGRAG
jgi:phosphoribosylanthranilate isomerase